jgi:glutathione S-transferase
VPQVALEHHAGRVDYEWVEALGWTRKETKVSQDRGGTRALLWTGMLMERARRAQEGERPDEWYYHWKSEELIKYNPSALVPTLIDSRGRSVYESLVCIDFIDAVSGATGRDRLVSDDPVEAARGRVWADKVGHRSRWQRVNSVLTRARNRSTESAAAHTTECWSRQTRRSRKPLSRRCSRG